MRWLLPHQGSSGYRTLWSPVQGFPFKFFVSDLPYSSSKSAWAFISKQISNKKCCVSFAFTLWDLLLSQCCKHMAVASYSSDPQRHCNSYVGYLLLWNLLYRLVISMLEHLKLLLCKIDEEHLSLKKNPQKQVWNLSERVFWLLWIYITYPTTSAYAKQWFTVRLCLWRHDHSALKYLLGRNTQTHTQCPMGWFPPAHSPILFVVAWQPGNGGGRKRRRMRAHEGTWSSSLSLANWPNQLLVVLSCSIEIGHLLWPGLGNRLPKVRMMILFWFYMSSILTWIFGTTRTVLEWGQVR